MAYVLNPTDSQNSVTTYLKAQYPHIPFFPDGMMDAEEGIDRYNSQSIKPFGVIWFSTPRRSRRGRGFTSTKLDNYSAGMDLVIVARNGTEARETLNEIGDSLIDWKPENSGVITEGSALWRDSRAVIDSNNRPTRFAVTRRFQWGIQANKTI